MEANPPPLRYGEQAAQTVIGPRKRLHFQRVTLRSAFLYGENVLDQSQRTQARDREEIRGTACSAQSEERLYGSVATAARCQPQPGGQSLRSHRPPPRVHSPVQDFAPDLPRTRL